jgi:putative ABC transport system substrate-binding protein
LVGLQPDIIVANGTLATVGKISIVFTGGGDPVASDLVARLDRPGGNVTGFGNYEATLTAEYAH